MTRRDFCTAPLIASLLPAAFAAPTDPAEAAEWKLWYREPAQRWLDALPIGNGRLSAMVFGGVADERLELNESTLWSGAPNHTSVVPAGRLHLDEIRKLLFAGKYAEADELCRQYFAGREDTFGTHLPMATLLIETPHAAPRDYRRELDLDQAMARTSYSMEGVAFTREVFASHPANVIAVRLTADSPGRLSFGLRVDSGELPSECKVESSDTLLVSGSAWEKMHSGGRLGVNFHVRVRIIADAGNVTPESSKLQIDSANSATILVAAHTNFSEADPQGLCAAEIAAASEQPYHRLRSLHMADHQRLYRRVYFDLGGAQRSSAPTRERLAKISEGENDPQLAALFFQYGRYLMIAGSRPNSPLPLNLQGIWNDNRASKMEWTCDFHLDINTQQNYWQAENGNLSECNEPLFRLIESLAASGRDTARQLYGANGWVCHVYSNAWGFTAPGKGISWGLFVTGGAWLVTHLWDHFRYTQDRAFLAKRAYPVMKGAAEFFLDYLAPEPTHGWLVSGPSISPENQFLAPEGQHCSTSMGATCDRVLIYATFTSCLSAAAILGIDSDFRARVQSALDRLPPLMIGRHGQLQEWLQDFEEAQPNHRHTSHLLALYPLDQITLDGTPDLAKAARVTLERRLGQPDWEDTEWSRANLVNFFARLQDGESAYKHLTGLLQKDTDHNLLTFSRAGIASAVENIFAIDGNTAGAAGMAEMLLQSHGPIHLLPALPGAWPEGAVTGLRARGGFEVAMRWSGGTLQQARITSKGGGSAQVRYGTKTVALHLAPGASISYNGKLLPVI